jgi:DNA polymerase bacteriophage-type
VQNWPQANPEIVAYWARLDASAKAAMRNPGTVFQCLSVAFEMRDQVLFVRLPSGRELCYPSPTIKPGKFGHAHRPPNLRQKLVAAIRPDL